MTMAPHRWVQLEMVEPPYWKGDHMHLLLSLKPPINEVVKRYAPDTSDRKQLEAALEALSQQTPDIPLIIGGKEVRTNNIGKIVMPHNHKHVLATYHLAGPREIDDAIKAALDARHEWQSLHWQQRVSIFLKAAELIANERRMLINAATMLGQSKGAYQAEIDAACELIDFLRFNAYFASDIYKEQPASSAGLLNRTEYRPLEGFVYAISPFNFTAIGGNLPTAPAMMGNVAIWKPATTAIYSNYLVMRALIDSGLPAGVINFVPADPATITDKILAHRDLAGVHFTGSTSVFNQIWSRVGQSINDYKSYPRLVGETGGKDFVFAHPTADVEALSVALVTGAFEYQGQKCSAASRAYIPSSLAPQVIERTIALTKALKVGDVKDFENHVNAVIDKRAFQRITDYIEHAKHDPDVTILIGGTYDDRIGYFINPTVLLTKNPKSLTMCEEIFGPVLTLYVYEDDQIEQTLQIVDETSPYALTGAIFAQDRYAIEHLQKRLVHSAGNFYINDKPTGAVVGQQPFGGARASGTNDKAGSALNLLRWVSPRTVKESFYPPKSMPNPF